MRRPRADRAYALSQVETRGFSGDPGSHPAIAVPAVLAGAGEARRAALPPIFRGHDPQREHPHGLICRAACHFFVRVERTAATNSPLVPYELTRDRL